ncbi:hypothetical protein KFL_009320040, partial [Klebsormidium nitens]
KPFVEIPEQPRIEPPSPELIQSFPPSWPAALCNFQLSVLPILGFLHCLYDDSDELFLDSVQDAGCNLGDASMPATWLDFCQDIRPVLQKAREALKTAEKPEDILGALRCLIDGDVQCVGLLAACWRRPWAHRIYRSSLKRGGRAEKYVDDFAESVARELGNEPGDVAFWETLESWARSSALNRSRVFVEELLKVVQGDLERGNALSKKGTPLPKGNVVPYARAAPDSGAPSGYVLLGGGSREAGDGSGRRVTDARETRTYSVLPSPGDIEAFSFHGKISRVDASRDVQLFYFTERARSAEWDPQKVSSHYTNTRRAEEHGAFECGWVSAHLPEQAIELDKARKVKIERVQALQPEQCRAETFRVEYQHTIIDSLRGHLNRLNVDKVVLIFHGYCVGFDQAILMAARIMAAVSPENDLLGIVCDWPSKNARPCYHIDARQIPTSTDSFFRLGLGDSETYGVGALGKGVIPLLQHPLDGEPLVREIYLFAHSMGNQLLMNGLALTRDFPIEDREALRQVVCLASDIDVEALRRGLKSGLWHINPTSRVTLYFSANDWALRGSTWINWSEVRVGADPRLEGFLPPAQQDRFDRVDCASVGNLIDVGHSYHVSSHPVRMDLREVFQGTSASHPQRLGRTVKSADTPQPGLFQIAAWRRKIWF